MADTIQTAAPRTNGLIIHWAARYDVLAWLLTRGRERAFREHLVGLADIRSGDSVLDVGCGTGTLAIAAARRAGQSGAVIGIDASPEMIARSTRKAARARVAVAFQVAAAEELPFPDARFDVVLSTLMLHHLPKPTRQRCAAEIRRVLRPGGRVLAVDFDRAHARRGLLAHIHRHGHVPVEDIIRVLTGAGLSALRSGAVGMADLRYVVAEAPSAASAQDERATS